MASWEERVGELRRGKPRGWIEENLFIVDEKSKLVRLSYDVNQVYYDEQVMQPLGRWDEGQEAFCLKDRKARWTTWVLAQIFAYFINVPNIAALVVSYEDDAAEEAGRVVDTFYNNLSPEWQTPQGHWGSDFKEVLFGPVGGDGKLQVKATSSIRFATARNMDLGRGSTYKIVFLDEMGRYQESYAAQLVPSLMEGLPPGAWRFIGSTAKGAAGQFRKYFLEVKQEKRAVVYLFRPWFVRPENALRSSDRETLYADGGELALTDEEQTVAQQFPEDGVPIQDRIRWRRRRIYDATVTRMGDEAAGRALFFQEHPENDLHCWQGDVSVLFGGDVLQQLYERAKPTKEDGAVAPGLRLRVWEQPMSWGRYVGGMDVGKGEPGSDATVLQVLDQTGVHVAEMYGRVPMFEAALQSVRLMERYNRGLLAPESTGLGAGFVEMVLRTGYSNVYRAPPRSWERPDVRRPYGWETTAGSRRRMLEDLMEAVNKGRLITSDRELIQELLQTSMTEHMPDRVAALAIAWQVRQGKSEAAWREPGGQASRQPVLARPFGTHWL